MGRGSRRNGHFHEHSLESQDNEFTKARCQHLLSLITSRAAAESYSTVGSSP